MTINSKLLKLFSIMLSTLGILTMISCNSKSPFYPKNHSPFRSNLVQGEIKVHINNIGNLEKILLEYSEYEFRVWSYGPAEGRVVLSFNYSLIDVNTLCELIRR